MRRVRYPVRGKSVIPTITIWIDRVEFWSARRVCRNSRTKRKLSNPLKQLGHLPSRDRHERRA
jgi:hypothetical protein